MVWRPTGGLRVSVFEDIRFVKQVPGQQPGTQRIKPAPQDRSSGATNLRLQPFPTKRFSLRTIESAIEVTDHTNCPVIQWNSRIHAQSTARAEHHPCHPQKPIRARE
jgi:hypothetical protein